MFGLAQTLVIRQHQNDIAGLYSPERHRSRLHEQAPQCTSSARDHGNVLEIRCE